MKTLILAVVPVVDVELAGPSNSEGNRNGVLGEFEVENQHDIASINVTMMTNELSNISSDPSIDDPFKDVLVWPKVNDNTTAKKRRKQEHVPSVATSGRWLQWHNKKESEKHREEIAKKARVEKRKLIKQQREKQKEEQKRDKIEKNRQRDEEKELKKEEKENAKKARKKKQLQVKRGKDESTQNKKKEHVAPKKLSIR